MSAGLGHDVPEEPTTTGHDRRARRGSGPEPLAVAGSRVAAAVLALSLLGLGVVAGREALAAWGAVGGGSWLPTVADSIGAVGPQWWVLPTAVALVLVGVALLLVALRPRRRRHLLVGDGEGVWVHVDDLARLVRASVADLPGVLEARVRGGRRVLRVDVVTTASVTAPVRTQVERLVEQLLEDVHPRPRARVRVRTGGAR